MEIFQLFNLSKKELFIMVEMKNIEKKDMIISAICYPEGKADGSFKIAVNSDTSEIVENTSGSDSIYSSISAYKLLKMKDNLPKEETIMWY